MKLWEMTFRTQIAHVNSKNRKGSFWSVLVILINDCVCSLMIVGGTNLYAYFSICCTQKVIALDIEFGARQLLNDLC